MPLFLKLLRLIFIGIFGISVVAAIVGLGIYIYFAPGLPDVDTLKDVELQVPLKVYSRDEKLIAVYGEKRRVPLSIDQYPKTVIQSFLAAEDDRFFEHPGVDYQGLIRAVYELMMTGEKRQGGSTITMQLARNFFLGNERTYVRKLREIFLALQIEHQLSKQEILELYLNKIYLGNRAYGVGAAAAVYYGVSVDELDLAQIAMIAGLPKAPSRFNPVVNPDRAVLRRNYVLNRMHDLGYIDDELHQNAIEAPVTASRHYPRVDVNAPYIGEMARAYMVKLYGKDAYNKGFNVYTTIDSNLQQVARNSLSHGLQAYDQRHGFRGVEAKVQLTYKDEEIDQVFLDTALRDLKEIGELIPAIITEVESQKVEIYLGALQYKTLSIEQFLWARPYLNENAVGKEPSDLTAMFNPGDVIRVVETQPDEFEVSQIPEVAGAFVAIDPNNGSILSLVGGFDYYQSKFNRAVQAKRQPGSSFKPFIYSAALASGYTPASVVNDAPVVFEDVALEDTWRPQNYSGKFFGPTRLRDALRKSRNMVSIRLLKEIGSRQALQHISHFGFDAERLPNNLSLALGSGEVTPLELAKGYAVFANGGYYIEPYLVERIDDVKGNVIFRSNPLMVCEEDCQAMQKLMLEDQDVLFIEDEVVMSEMRMATRVIPKDNAYQMTSLMKDVINRGTATKAKVIGRNDIAGKTGTTNDQHDAWFSGYNGDIVATAWVGFDQHKPLGRREPGGIAALPIWIQFMQTALKGRPENSLDRPENIVTMRIDPTTGLLVNQESSLGIEETFREEFVPTKSVEIDTQITFQQGTEQVEIPEQLF